MTTPAQITNVRLDDLIDSIKQVHSDPLEQLKVFDLAEALSISYAEAEGIKVGMPTEVQTHLESLLLPLGRELRGRRPHLRRPRLPIPRALCACRPKPGL